MKLPVKNCAIVRQTKDVVNRVEVDTGFNFDTVVQILLSEPEPCPEKVKDGYALRFVVLSTGKPMLMLLLPPAVPAGGADSSMRARLRAQRLRYRIRAGSAGP